MQINDKVKITVGDFKDLTGRIVGQSAAGEIIVELDQRNHECVHVPLASLAACSAEIIVNADMAAKG